MIFSILLGISILGSLKWHVRWLCLCHTILLKSCKEFDKLFIFFSQEQKQLHFRHLKTELIFKELFGAKMTHMPYECSRCKKELGCRSILFCNLAALFA